MINTKIKWIVLIAVIFIIGGAFGFLGGQAYQKHVSRQRRQDRQNSRPNFSNFRQKFIEDLKKELNLTEEQTKTITQILDQSHKKIETEMSVDREKVMQIRKEAEKDINTVLNMEQQKKYAQWREKRDRERERRWGQDTTNTINRDTTIKKEK